MNWNYVLFSFQSAEIAEGVWCCAIKVQALINRAGMCDAQHLLPGGKIRQGSILQNKVTRLLQQLQVKLQVAIRICKLPFQKDLYFWQFEIRSMAL